MVRVCDHMGIIGGRLLCCPRLVLCSNANVAAHTCRGSVIRTVHVNNSIGVTSLMELTALTSSALADQAQGNHVMCAGSGAPRLIWLQQDRAVDHFMNT